MRHKLRKKPILHRRSAVKADNLQPFGNGKEALLEKGNNALVPAAEIKGINLLASIKKSVPPAQEQAAFA